MCTGIFYLLASSTPTHLLPLLPPVPIPCLASPSVAAGPKSGGQGSNLSSSTIEITLCCGTRSSKKKLPRTTTISAVKLLCSRMFKIQPDRQLLLLHQQGLGARGGNASSGIGVGAEAPEEITGDDTQTLGYFESQVGLSVV